VILTALMAWTQEDVDALKSLIKTGAQSVSYGGPPERTMTARPLTEMLQLLAVMEREVKGSSAITYRLASTKKGL
jgi:hypothetical protein